MRTALQGFISDPEEEAELRSRAYQAERVHALAIGIQRYLSKSPPLARSRPLSRQS
jgi:N-acetylmuramoyl-L-alanine amidase